MLAARHDVVTFRNEYQEKVAFLHLDILLFLVGIGRQDARQTRIRVHGSGDKEENQQQEGDVGHRTGIDLLYFSFISCHCLLLSYLNNFATSE